MNNNFKVKKNMASKSKHCLRLCPFKNHARPRSDYNALKKKTKMLLSRNNPPYDALRT